MNEAFVFDTNVLLSALLFENSKPTKAFERARVLVNIYVSDATLQEFSEVFLRPKFDKYFSNLKRKFLLRQFLKTIIKIEINESITACRDPKDNKFLELAVTANASCIVTGDTDLLILHPFRAISILNASDFLDNY